MKKLIFIIICVASLFICNAGWGGMASVRGDIVIVRSDPSKSSPVLWKICKKCPVSVLETRGDWSRIKDFEGDVGWIHNSALFEERIAVVVSDEAVINSDNVNLRSGPGDFHSILDQLKRGRAVRILERESNWALVKYDREKSGWLMETALSNVHTGDVNVRKGPGLEYNVVFKTGKGVIFRIIERKGRWLRVDHEKGYTGWIREDLVWGE